MGTPPGTSASLVHDERHEQLAAPPLVSVIIPCRNERDFIAECLDSVLATLYPIERLEFLVVDGMSDDGTREVLTHFAREHRCIRVLDNPKRIAPAALNIGIAHARGSVIMRMDAHNEYPPRYIPDLVGWLERSQADNVGGVCHTRPARATPIGSAIAMGLSHPFGVGNSYFRIGTSQPRWVDTVPFGCYRRDVFERIGLFDEDLVRNQDDEFNARLTRNGGRILLVPEVVSRYYARASLAKLWRMYFQYGYFKPLAIRKLGTVPTVRQLVPALFVSALATLSLLTVWLPPLGMALSALLTVYLGAILATSIQVSMREKTWVGLLLWVVFPVLHLSYGLGFLKGGWDFLLLSTLRPQRPSAVPLSR